MAIAIWIVRYLMCGGLFTMMMDYVLKKTDMDEGFTNKERLIMIVIWPVGLWGFIVGLLSGGNE